MEGFLTKEQIEEARIEQGSSMSCIDCGLYRNCKSPKMPVQYPENCENLIILPKPTMGDDTRGCYLKGDSGNFLKKKLISKNIHIHRRFAITSAVQCHVGKVPKIAIAACRSRLKETIKKLRPLNIIPLGPEAIETLLGESFKRTSIERFRGLIVPDQTYKAWILPTFSPDFIMTKDNDPNAQAFYNHEWAHIVRHIRTVNDVPVIPNELRNVVCLYDYEQIIDILKKAYVTDSVVIDYETTGLKPYAAGHKIVSVSVDFSGKSYSFPWQYQRFFTREQQDMIGFQLKRIWMKKGLKKIAHNSKFEHIWTLQKVGAKPVNWHWCTLMGAHCQDNRRQYSGLKFQTWVHFGHRPYNEETETYINSHGEEFNRMDECPLNILLPYGGLDTRWTRKLYDKQVEFYKKNSKMKQGFDLFNKGAITLGNIQHNGIPVDIEYCHNAKTEIKEKIELVEELLRNSKESILFKQHTGRELTIKEKDYSDFDLRILFYDILKYDTDVETKKSKQKSVGKEVIEDFDSPFANLIIKRRKLRKIYSKIEEFERCTYEGVMHPFFDLIVPVSYRGCIAKGSKVLAVRDFKKYPDGVPIEEIKVGDSVYCYDNDLRPVIRKVVWAGKTGYKKVIRVHWKGSRNRYGYLDLTPEHKVRLISGEWARADELDKDYSKRIPKCRVLAGHRAIGNDDRLYFTGITVPEHRFIYSNLIGPLEDHEIVHHKDGDHSNHDFDNLEKIETLSDHSKLHNSFNDPKIREKNIKAVRKAWKNGKYNTKKRKESFHRLNLSKIQCLRLLCMCKGKITNVKKYHDFNTFKKYIKKYQINLRIIKIRYTPDGRYIPKGMLLNFHKKGGFEYTRKVLGIGYYRLKELYEWYKIPLKSNNHIIIKIEYLKETTDVYNLEVEEFHNFIANEICVKNSCYDPNFQNIQKRDAQAKRYTRRAIQARALRKILESDFSGIEVCLNACYNKDPVLIEDVTNPLADMHRDTAAELWMLDTDEIEKMIRFYAKNQWVFPQFYGSWYDQCAKNLWRHCLKLKAITGFTLKDHLKSKGIVSLDAFTDHCKKVEKSFWQERFKVYNQWKMDIQKEYQKNGYTETYLGLRFSQLMARNEITNYLAQGTAFHCLLWTLIQVEDSMVKEQMSSLLIGQIHDSMLTDLEPCEEKIQIDIINYHGTDAICKKWKWITVPLKIDHEATPIGGTWYEKKELK